MRSRLRRLIEAFFERDLRGTFVDENYAFDVYVPPPYERVWLVDVNPWAERTDPLLFSWLELLTMERPQREGDGRENGVEEKSFRLELGDADGPASDAESVCDDGEDESNTEYGDEEDVEELDPEVELRLVEKDDPEAFNFASPQYSAHKLPRDVVDASRGDGGTLRDFAQEWSDALARREDGEDASSEDG